MDLKLAPGTNTLSLTAVDLAGNTATLRFHYVFDTSTDSTPPALALLWPQDGMEVSGATLTLRGTLDDDTATVSAQYLDADGMPTLLPGLVERGGQFWLQGLPLNPGTNTVLVTATDAAGNTSTTNLTLLQSAVVLTMNQPPSSELNYATVNLWGSISEPDYVVRVNGVQGVNNHGAWSADNVPVTSGGTASFDITAYPPDGAPAAPSWTNYGIAQLAYPNPAAPAPVHAHYEQDKPPVVYMQSSTWAYSYAFTNAEGTKAFTYSEVSHWSRESGGSFVATRHIDDLDWPEGSETTVRTTTWPPDSGLLPSLPGRQVVDYYDPAGNLVYEAVIPALPPQPAVQHAALSNAPDICWAFPYNLTAQNVIKLFTGKAVRDKEALFIVGANLSHEIVNLCATAPFLLPTTSIPSPAITLETFGQLYPDGLAGKVLALGQNPTITPHTAAALAGAWLPSVSPGPLVHVVQHLAQGNTRLDRTTLGVGEEVLLTGQPPDTKWTTTGGGLTTNVGSMVFFTAPSNAPPGGVTVTVSAQWRNTRAQQVVFTVVPPTGIDHVDFLGHYTFLKSVSAAGMLLRPYFGPLSVSFYRISFREVPSAATNISGYYTNYAPQSLRHVPEDWGPVDDNNAWVKEDIAARTANSVTPWARGRFEWDIPAEWKIGNGQTNRFTNVWTQTFTLENASGTMTVEKFGHIVTRNTNDVYEVSH